MFTSVYTIDYIFVWNIIIISYGISLKFFKFINSMVTYVFEAEEIVVELRHQQFKYNYTTGYIKANNSGP